MTLKQKTISGIAWSSFGQIVQQLLRFTISVILARILSPEEFGLIGMITVFTGFAYLFGDFGFTSAIIQREKVEERHYSSIFWLNLGIGIILTVLFISISEIIANFYDKNILRPLTILISFTFTINALCSVQRAILSKKMLFKLLALRSIISRVFAGLIAIILALKGFGVWSLAWQLFFYSIISVLMYWWVSGWKPRLIFNISAIKELWFYSYNYFGSLMTNYWIRNADNLLVGKYFGSSSLGIYSRAYGLMVLPMQQINLVVGRVMFPALSKIQKDKEKVKSVFLRAVAAIALLTFPIFGGLFIISRDFILALYGSKWAGVIPILQILSIAGLFQSVIYANAWILTSQGRTDLLFKWYLVRGILIIGSIALGLWYGTIIAVALFYSIMSSIILFYPEYYIIGKVIDLKFKEVIRSLSGIFFSCVLMIFLIIGLDLILPNNLSHFFKLIIKTLLGSACYLFLIHKLKLDAYQEVKGIIKNKVHRNNEYLN
ncbi:MAG: MOP flippase family protein [Candidatus Odinarchaeota archaeon]